MDHCSLSRRHTATLSRGGSSTCAAVLATEADKAAQLDNDEEDLKHYIDDYDDTSQLDDEFPLPAPPSGCPALTSSAYYRRMRLTTASTLDLPVSQGHYHSGMHYGII